MPSHCNHESVKPSTIQYWHVLSREKLSSRCKKLHFYCDPPLIQTDSPNPHGKKKNLLCKEILRNYQLFREEVHPSLPKSLDSKPMEANWRFLSDWFWLNYFIIRFQKEENRLKTLHSGPGSLMDISSQFRKWEPNFVAATTI